MSVKRAWAEVEGLDRMQFDFWPPESDWVAPGLPEWDPVDRPLGIDLETKDDGISEGWGAGWPVKKGHILGVSVTTPGQPGVYLPFNHVEGNGEYTQDKVLDWVAWAMSRASVVVGHNLSYDLGWLLVHGIPVPDHIFDTQVGAALLDENRRHYDLDSVGQEYGFEGKDTALLLEAAKYHKLGKSKKQIMGNLWKLPAKYVGPYAEQDSVQALQLYQVMRKQLFEEGMAELVQVEMTMVKVAIAMRAKGIPVDVPYAEKLNKDWIAEQSRIEDLISNSCGFRVKPSDPEDLKRLCDYHGVFDIPTTEKKNDLSFKNHWMSGLQIDDFDWCVKWRNIQHSRNNYVEGIVLSVAVDGRVYPEINTVKKDDGGTVSGRLSVNNPPLQQISARNPLVGPAVRACFLPEHGQKWGAFDYSQQEPRLAVHFAALLKIAGSAEAVEYYKNDPNADFHSMMAELTGMPRKIAKNLFLGMIYGMGNSKLANELDTTIEECMRIRDNFDARVPWVSGLSQKCIQRASSAGYIRTLLNRRCRFNLWEPYGNKKGRIPLRRDAAEKKWKGQNLRRAFLHKSLNRLIQPSAADQVKKAMVVMYGEGIIPMLQMHDELDFSLEHEDCTERHQIEDIMLHSTELLVPSKVDLGLGNNWGEAE